MADILLDVLESQINCFTDPTYKRFVALGWRIIEAKIRYYILDTPVLEDFEFDILVREYEQLSTEYGIPPTANMVGADMTRPCFRRAFRKLTGYDYENHSR